MYAFVQARGYPAHEAEDLTQTFFARLLEKNYVAQAEPARGRFRSFLLGAVKHFLANEHDREMAQKRGGDRAHSSIEDETELAGPLTPEMVFDKRWALTILAQVIDELQAEATADGRKEEFDRLLPFVTGEAARGGYADVAAQTGLGEGALRVAVHRLRLRFREHLRRMIAATVLQPQDVDDEIRFLIDAVSSDGAARAR